MLNKAHQTFHNSMQPTNTQDYKQLLTDVIKKQIIILGPDITLSKSRNVKGLTVSDDGTVTDVTGSAEEVTQALVDQFVQLSGLIVKKTMEPLLALSHMAAPTVAAPITAPMQTEQTTKNLQEISQPIEPQQAPIAATTNSMQSATPSATKTQATTQAGISTAPVAPIAPMQEVIQQTANLANPLEQSTSMTIPSAEKIPEPAKNPLAA